MRHSLHDRNLRSRMRGMSMVEVMVALGLSALLMAGAFALVASQRRTYMAQSAIGKRQQELWLGLEFIQRDLRKAGMGFGFCRATSGSVTYAAHADCNPNGAGAVGTLHAVDFADGGTSASDTLTIYYAQPPGDGGYDGKLAGSIVTWAGTSVVLDNTATGGERNFMSPYGCVCSGTPACSFAASTFAVLFNAGNPAKACSLVQVTGANCTTHTLTIQPRPTVACSTAQYTPAATTTYVAGDHITNLGALHSVLYRINAASASTNTPLLERVLDGGAAQTIAVGVEDLQIVPACDLNNNGLIDPEGTTPSGKTTDEWLNNVGADTFSTNCTTYPQIRVSLVGRTAQAAAGYVGPGRPALENRLAGAADDFHRRVLSTTVATPNLAL